MVSGPVFCVSMWNSWVTQVKGIVISGEEDHMKKRIQYIIVTMLLLACSGCFPVFVPVGGEGRHGGGEHEHHDHDEHGGHDDHGGHY